jgi:hypothetical protein
VEANNGVKECVGDRCRTVQVRQWNEVCHLRESVDHSEDHSLVVDTRQSLNEVHGQVNPHHARQVQWQKEIGQLQWLHLVALVDVARQNKFWATEYAADTKKSTLR